MKTKVFLIMSTMILTGNFNCFFLHFRVAQHAQKGIVGAMMHDQCSMNDLKEITASIRMAKSVLGDTCDSDIVKMSHVHYSETCDLDKAAMCLRSVNISYMVEHSDKIGQHTVCR